PWDPFQAQDIKFGAYCLSNLGWFGGVSGNHSIFKLVVFHGVPGSGVTVAGPLGGVGEGVARSPLKWMCRGLQLGLATTWKEGFNKYYFSWYLRNKWSVLWWRRRTVGHEYSAGLLLWYIVHCISGPGGWVVLSTALVLHRSF
ncbi:hypothetical protein PoMZ_07722, partial [Pyricularia oryzae]